jgi:hypothetical protein
LLNKILTICFFLLLLGKLFFRPQLSAVRKWFDGVINAMLIAIAIVYAIQVALWLSA